VALGFALLYDVSYHLHDSNTKLQGQQKLISYVLGAVRAFEMKLFRKKMGIVNLSHFLL
jgi:hypothetical protein